MIEIAFSFCCLTSDDFVLYKLVLRKNMFVKNQGPIQHRWWQIVGKVLVMQNWLKIFLRENFFFLRSETIPATQNQRTPKRRLRDLFQACTHAALPDFPTFRQPCSHQKLPLVLPWLLSLQRKPKVVTLYVYKFTRDLRGYADFAATVSE